MKRCLILAFCAFFFSCSSEDKTSETLGKISADFGECKRSALENPAIIEEDAEPSVSTDDQGSVTVLDGKTLIHLPSISKLCSTSLEIKAAKSNDTLKLEYYLPEGKDYLATKCNCVSDLDLIIESVENDIKYIVFGNGVYQVKQTAEIAAK